MFILLLLVVMKLIHPACPLSKLLVLVVVKLIHPHVHTAVVGGGETDTPCMSIVHTAVVGGGETDTPCMSIVHTAGVGGGETDTPCMSILLMLVVMKLIHPACSYCCCFFQV
jgi:hypothetical protein